MDSICARYFSNRGLFAAFSPKPENTIDSILASLRSTTVESFSLAAVHSTSESVLNACSSQKQKSQNACDLTR